VPVASRIVLVPVGPIARSASLGVHTRQNGEDPSAFAYQPSPSMGILTQMLPTEPLCSLTDYLARGGG